MTHQPPIVQLLLTVQLKPAVQSLTIVDWADLRAHFLADYPIFAQVGRAGAMNPDPTVETLDNPLGLPRLQLVSDDLTGLIFLQDDRVSVGWQRASSLSDDPEYPGFSAILKRALAVVQEVITFFGKRATETVEPAAAEIVYTDAFLMIKDGVMLRTLGDVFRCVQSIEEFKFNRLQLSYQRLLKEDDDALTGNVQTTISGLVATASGEVVSNLQTVVRFDAGRVDADELDRRFRSGQQVAHKIYGTLVNPDACAILAKP